MKHRSEFKHGFTNRGCLHCAILKALHGFSGKKNPQVKGFFLQNVQNETFLIFKMYKNNMKFTRAVSWINSKISNKWDENTTLLLVILCCNYWKSLKLDSHLPKNCFKNDENCFLFPLKSSPRSQDI